MRRRSLLIGIPSLGVPSLLFALAAFFGCSDELLETPNGPTSTAPSLRDGGGPPNDEGGTTNKDGGKKDGGNVVVPANGNVRILAGNITSGTNQKYDNGEGIRILQALKPDVALLQEMNYLTNSTADIQDFSTKAFGADYTFFREDGQQIPNAVFSRYPIVESGRWAALAPNRGFAWAKIVVPGNHNLWAVSVHLLTTGGANRATEAAMLVTELKKVVVAGDFVTVGGDFNTDNRTETCVTNFAEILDSAGPYPADQGSDETTNSTRSRPYDWVLVNSPLKAFQVPTVVGAVSRPAGLVFDTRVFTPIADAPPAMSTDSSAENMQHMAVVKDFKL